MTSLIDTDVNNTPANTATSFGTVERCSNWNPVGGTVEVDVVVSGIPPAVAGHGGISGFEFDIVYIEEAVEIGAINHEMLLAANAGSSIFEASDSTPDTDGVLKVAAVDVGEGASESGNGVLARITVRGLVPTGAPGTPLILQNVAVLDAAGEVYPVAATLTSRVLFGSPEQSYCATAVP